MCASFTRFSPHNSLVSAELLVYANAAQDAVDPVEAALLKFAHAGGNKDPVVEETLLRLVPTCRSLYEKQSARSQKPPATATRAKFDQKTFDREISDQLSVLLVDYLQSDSRVQTALNRFRKFTGDNSSHISGVSTSKCLGFSIQSFHTFS